MFIHSMILCPWFVQTGCAISIHDITHLPTLLPIGPISVLDMKVLQCHICYNYYHKLSNNKKQAQHLPFITSPTKPLPFPVNTTNNQASLTKIPSPSPTDSKPPPSPTDSKLPLCPTDSTQSSNPPVQLLTPHSN